tara:strand:- start:64 stop:243 length:180 start_codon:yes stop_codon:yes gene_type:complete
MYKAEKTTYVVRKIPVTLWKEVKSRMLFSEDYKSIGDLVINLLEKWVQEKKDDTKNITT